mmetsp:Transcript_19953/g.75380  ORF Transcript_19953/g.75380 Transcript_19953/m.75380 type:complete len:353 (-) Transcript_19953:422-1480(-)
MRTPFVTPDVSRLGQLLDVQRHAVFAHLTRLRRVGGKPTPPPLSVKPDTDDAVAAEELPPIAHGHLVLLTVSVMCRHDARRATGRQVCIVPVEAWREKQHARTDLQLDVLAPHHWQLGTPLAVVWVPHDDTGSGLDRRRHGPLGKVQQSAKRRHHGDGKVLDQMPTVWLLQRSERDCRHARRRVGNEDDALGAVKQILNAGDVDLIELLQVPLLHGVSPASVARVSVLLRQHHGPHALRSPAKIQALRGGGLACTGLLVVVTGACGGLAFICAAVTLPVVVAEIDAPTSARRGLVLGIASHHVDVHRLPETHVRVEDDDAAGLGRIALHSCHEVSCLPCVVRTHVRGTKSLT